MSKCSIAVDIGASSGRLIAGCLQDNNLKLEEIHRFENNLIIKDGHYCWDVHALYNEIKTGIRLCRDRGLHPESIGIDTWAVDFVLLDEKNRLLTDAIAYRDARTDGMMEEVFNFISKERLYLETGIQFQKFNTIYQLYSLKKSNPEVLEQATSFMMLPDYFNYLLTGKKVNEYTNATSTQLVNAFTKKWDEDLLDLLGINKEMFLEIKPPGSILGDMETELSKELGIEMKVILPATHDTGSAVVAVPEVDDTVYISSGTWSLIGVENPFPICITKALDYNFTNEGGFSYQYRFLKNVMGLWMIQEVKRNYNDQYSFSELVELADKASEFGAKINVDNDRFLKPENMIEEIQKVCQETNQEVPGTPGEVAKCVFDSLGVSYQKALDQIEEIYEKEFKKINIIGGGCQNEMLNQLIADKTGKEVIAGPVEATAIGNLVSQLISLGKIKDIKEARNIIGQSFKLKRYTAAGREEENVT